MNKYNTTGSVNLLSVEKMECSACGRTYSTKSNLLRHQRDSCLPAKRFKAAGSRYCSTCNVSVPATAFVGHQRSVGHGNSLTKVTLGDGIQLVQTAYKSRIASFRITATQPFITVTSFMNDVKDKVLNLVRSECDKHVSVKLNCELFGLFYLESKSITDTKSFNSKNEVVTCGTDLNEVYDTLIGHFDERISEFQEKDSGWILLQLLYIDVNICKFNPLRASSYIPTPVWIQRKRAIVNVHNNDEYCFFWSVISALCEPTGPNFLTTSYPHFRTIIDSNVEAPVKLTDIPKFEKLNPQLSINVYGLEKIFSGNKWIYQVVGPLYLTKNRRLGHINLLLLMDDDGNSHYTWITDLGKLVNSQVFSRKGVSFFCDSCLNYFYSEERFERHYEDECSHIYTKLPTLDLVLDAHGQEVRENILKFKNYHRQLVSPFVIYADFESLLKPIQTALPNPKNSFTVTTCEHQPYSFAYYVKCSFDNTVSKYVTYRGVNVVDEFMENLEKDAMSIYNHFLKDIRPMNALLPQQLKNHSAATSCYICELPFDITNPNLKKVKDHCHVTGNYRGPAHSICNLNHKIPYYIPIFFHNLNYDSHLFVKQLATKCEDVQVIPQTKEKYISFSKRILVDTRALPDGKLKNIYITLRFLDSFRFLHFPLSDLAKSLTPTQCVEICKEFGSNFELMRLKGVFPYSYVDSFAKLNQTSLPTMTDFYDKLKEEHISSEEYSRANKVWTTFNCKTLGEYSDIYLKTDVLLLTDVFESYRSVCLRHYKLDPAHYYTAPGFSWDAMLRYTSVKLELLTDINMLHFFRKGIRGGVSTCIKRKAEANNPFVDNYDITRPTSYIMYLDATNLYGCAMREYLPQKDFVWLTDQEIQNFDVMQVSDTSDVGFVLEVDLAYPDALHDDHNDLPFCPELMVPPTSKFKNSKLIPNLNDKYKYVIHYKNLKQCLDAGLVLTRTHRVLKFKQSPWLRPYIDLNTKLRNQATNEFERDCFKLKTNSVFGKTMENVDKRVDVKLVSHWEKIGRKGGAEKLIAKPNFKDVAIFSENLVAVELNRTHVIYDKPMFVGFSILDLSKTIIYDFYYNYLKRKYPNKVSLLYTDTDSLILEVFTQNFYDDMKQEISRFDTSNYKKSKLHGMPITKSIVGKMKDEYCGVAISNFYGTSAKSYCVTLPEKEILKAKGVRSSAVKKYLSVATYKAVVEGTTDKIFCKQYTFKSHLHTIYTELQNRVAISAVDDKRYVIHGSPRTLAWGNNILNINILVDMLLKTQENIPL